VDWVAAGLGFVRVSPDDGDLQLCIGNVKPAGYLRCGVKFLFDDVG